MPADTKRALGFWALHVRVGETKLTDAWIEREAVDSSLGRIHEHRGGPIDNIAGGDLSYPLLEKIFVGRGAFSVFSAVDGKNGSDRHIDIDV